MSKRNTILSKPYEAPDCQVESIQPSSIVCISLLMLMDESQLPDVTQNDALNDGWIN